MKDIINLVTELLLDLKPNHKKVIEGRFGLKTGVRSTLQSVGDEIGVTRERVRQIEEQAVKQLGENVRSRASDMLSRVQAYLARSGGVLRDDVFVAELARLLNVNTRKVRQAEEKLRFPLLVAGVPFYSPESGTMHAFWYADDNSKKSFFEFVDQTRAFLESSDRQEILNNKAVMAEYSNSPRGHLLSISRQFGVNVFGDFGLRSWPEIKPRTIRDRAYLVLKKHGEPLHFTDVASYISRYKIDTKPTHVQTVHNELIKDDRVVLVGRGFYALKEHGYEPGTVRDVVARLLGNEGPLKPSKVVRLVSKQRILKENTILLALRDRRYFKRLGDGRYTVREV